MNDPLEVKFFWEYVQHMKNYEIRIGVKVKDLNEGYEFQPNRFIHNKGNHGCNVAYQSQEGDTRLLLENNINIPVWYNNNDVIECIIDFVPESMRKTWNELNKIGKCALLYDSFIEYWYVNFYENPILNELIGERAYSSTPKETILSCIRGLTDEGLINNGYRWFELSLEPEFSVRKISNEEAFKLM